MTGRSQPEARPNGGVNDMFWGDRVGHFVDPFGHAWTVSTHVADLTEQEMEKGAAGLLRPMAREEVGVAYGKHLNRKGRKELPQRPQRIFLATFAVFLCALCG